jgi:hypothetical protein
MTTFVRVKIQIHIFLISALLEGEWTASRSGLFTRRKKPRYTSKRRLGGSQSRSGRYGKVKMFTLPVSNSEPSAVHLVASCYAGSGIEALGVAGCRKAFHTSGIIAISTFFVSILLDTRREVPQVFRKTKAH